MTTTSTPGHRPSASTAPRRPRAARSKRIAAQAAALPVPAVALVLAFFWGGYYESQWTWPVVVFVWAAVVALLLGRRPKPARLLRWWLAALVLLTMWTLTSALWSEPVPYAGLETRRAAIYLAGACALAAAAPRARVLLAAVAAAATVPAGYALARHVLPDVLGGYDPILVRLSEPLGYANAMGALAAIGASAALGTALVARRAAVRAAAGAALVVLLATLALSFGRGAFVALAGGLLVALALTPRRIAAAAAGGLVLTAPCAAAVAAASTDALTRRGVALDEAAAAGHRLAALLAFLAVVSGGAATAAPALRRRLAAATVSRRVAVGASAVVVAAALTAVAAMGGPEALATRGFESFTAPPKPTSAEAQRLLTLSSNLRQEYWRVAWRDWREHPLLGSGAGTFADYWAAHATIESGVLDAHSLYLETLAELGPIGLALVLAVVALPLAAGIAFRRAPAVPAAAAGWTVYALHAGIDWDWEMPAVTLPALACAYALLAAGRTGRARL